MLQKLPMLFTKYLSHLTKKFLRKITKPSNDFNIGSLNTLL